MTTYEMTNEQRKYFGLDPIQSHWDKVVFKGDTNRPESILYFDKDTIKKHIVSTDNQYFEKQYNEEQSKKQIPEIINDFIISSPENHYAEIEKYKNAKRKNIKFKSGDYFCFKLDRINFGFGRILLDVGKIRKKKLIDDFHGLGLFMGLPVIIELFAFKSHLKKHGHCNT